MFTTCGGHDQMLQHFCPPRPLVMDGSGWRSNVELAPNCPRCASSNTKFCYYNNYSLSQPRYFCKGCRRYWTKGGSLRNVPVGGGCRKNRRAKSSRLLQRQRGAWLSSSTSPDHNGNDKSADSCEYSNGEDSASHRSETSGADIDLAVVFARFVNQNPSTEPEFRRVPELRPDDHSNVLADSSQSSLNQGDDDQQHNAAFEYHEKPINGGEADHMLLEGFPREEKVLNNNQVFIEDDVNAFGLQNLLDDEVVQDALWSDDATANLPNFMWYADQSSTNLITDGTWSSLDLSGFEVFSRP
ncbi:hypothetical protein I3760_15G019900 [Carya illinoinensis]|nr:hypothetical protein I3760_15G019900 [Carya illinoinensis]